MTQAEAIAKLQQIFDDILLDSVPLTAALSARDVEEWDSLLHVSIVVAVERAFNIKFRVGEVEAAENIGQFAALIVHRLEQA